MDMFRSIDSGGRKGDGRLPVAIGFAWLLLAAAIAGCQHAVPRETAQCSSSVGGIDASRLNVLRGRPSILATAYAEDQKDRLLPNQRQLSDAEWDAIDRRDDSRLRQTVDALRSRDYLSSEDVFHASVMLLHGTCPDHYRLARDLATRSIELGDASAKSLFAHATDRYLVSIGKPQKYGTQYDCGASGCTLLPHDPATTDAERAQFGVPKLEAALRGMQ